MKRPITTLFMLSSVDGKISTGDVDSLDVDKDYPKIDGVKEGLQQYYDLEKQTDAWSLNTGRTMAKIGVNELKNPQKIEVLRLVIVDNKPHLEVSGIEYLAGRCKTLYIVTTNKDHPALECGSDNVEVIQYDAIDFSDLFGKLYKEHGAERLTIQSGGTLNALFLREGLIDRISLVIAPALIGGKDTSTLIDGESLHTEKDLLKIKALELKSCSMLKDSYLHLRYDVLNG